MIELDAAQVLTFPQVFKAREVVRRGLPVEPAVRERVRHLPGRRALRGHPRPASRRQGEEGQKGKPVEVPIPPPTTDADGNVQVDVETVINPKVAELGKPV